MKAFEVDSLISSKKNLLTLKKHNFFLKKFILTEGFFLKSFC